MPLRYSSRAASPRDSSSPTSPPDQVYEIADDGAKPHIEGGGWNFGRISIRQAAPTITPATTPDQSTSSETSLDGSRKFSREEAGNDDLRDENAQLRKTLLKSERHVSRLQGQNQRHEDAAAGELARHAFERAEFKADKEESEANHKRTADQLANSVPAHHFRFIKDVNAAMDEKFQLQSALKDQENASLRKSLAAAEDRIRELTALREPKSFYEAASELVRKEGISGNAAIERVKAMCGCQAAPPLGIMSPEEMAQNLDRGREREEAERERETGKRRKYSPSAEH